MNKKMFIATIIGIISLILVTIGATYAYFSANILGAESASTLIMTGATLTIEYSEGTGAISADNIYPKADAWITKRINLTGKNTTSDRNMPYTIGLDVKTNGFGNYLSYTLEGINSDSNGRLIGNGSLVSGTITDTTDIPSFGEGYFAPTGNDTKVHTYEFKLYFLDDGDQNDAQGASFSAVFTIDSSEITS